MLLTFFHFRSIPLKSCCVYSDAADVGDDVAGCVAVLLTVDMFLYLREL